MQESEEQVAILEVDPALDPKLDQMSRRALIGRVSAGAAASVLLPSMATAQDAPKHALEDPNINKSDVTYESRGVQVKAFLATPKGKRVKRGAVIVVQEIFGLNDHIKDVACRFAQAGYLALAPNFFTREGDPPSAQGGFGNLMQFVGKISDAQILDDTIHGAEFLRKLPGSNKKVGIVGFCWGGRVSMLASAKVPDLNAAVAYYGRIVGQKSENQPASPLELAPEMQTPLLGNFGGLDQGIPPSDVEKLREALKVHGKTAELYVYEGANHAFNNDTRESYNKEAAQLAWKRTLDWYKKHLK